MSPLRFNSVGGKHANTHTRTHSGAYIHINLTHTGLLVLKSQWFNPVNLHSQQTEISPVIQSPPSAKEENTSRTGSTPVGNRNNEVLTRSIYTGMYLNPFNVSITICTAVHQTVTMRKSDSRVF